MRDVLFGCARIVAYDSATMDGSEEKRKQVARLYAGMSDEELEELAGERLSLTEIGLELLGAEMSRRGLDLPPVKVVDHEAPGKVPVMIRQFRDLPGALLAKGFLESAGVDSFLVDETTIRMDWLWSNALGGIKLCVKSEDVEAATQILNQEIPEGFSAEGTGDFEQPRCPQCGSLKISFEDLDKRVAYAGLLFVGFPIPLHRGRWKCDSCGHVWQPNNDESKEKI
jgi:rubredoxin